VTQQRRAGSGRRSTGAGTGPGSDEATARLEAELAAARRDLEEAAAELEIVSRQSSSQRDRFEDQLAAARRLASKRERELGRVRPELDRIRGRRAVRVGSRLTGATRRVVGATRSAGSWVLDVARGVADGRRDPERSATHGLRASAAEERRLAEAIVGRLAPAPSPQLRPITIIVDWTGDPDRLRRTLDGLNRTAWPDRAVHIVDPTMSPGGAGQGGADQGDTPAIPGAPVFVAGRDRAAAYREILADVSTGLVLFLADEVEPLEPGWLARLVDGLDATGAGAAGPRLVLGRRQGPRRGPRTEAADLTLSRRGTSIVLEGGLPVAAGLGIGEDPRSARAEATTAVPALPRACLLVRPDALAAAGGFLPGDLADEPLDLFLRMREAGRAAAYVGASVMWDRATRHGTAPADAYGPPRVGEDHRACPAVFRAAFLEGLAGAQAWTGRPISVGLAFAGTGASSAEDRGFALGLGRAFGRLGWRTSQLEVADEQPPTWDPAVAAAIVVSPEVGRGRLPRNLVTVALVQDRPDDWLADPRFDDHDIVVAASEEIRTLLDGRSAKRAIVVPAPATPDATPDALARFLRDTLARWASAKRIAIHIAPPDWVAATNWGDTQFARALQKEFERRDWAAAVLVNDERDSGPAIRADVALHVLGVDVPPVRSGQVSLLWVISHPDRVTALLCERYDLVFVASRLFGRQLAERVGKPVLHLPQATDPSRFFPDRSGPTHELLFVGNSRRSRRPILDALAQTSHDLAVYGSGWTPDLLDPRHLRGEWIPNDQLHCYYSGAAIVLSDHWRDMRDDGFISNRVYDALASGAFVVSDRVPGIDEEFDAAVATYERGEELEAIIEHYLAHPEERRERAERGRSAVLARHTFAHRVDAIIAALGGLLDHHVGDAARPDKSAPADVPAVGRQ
jgi:glycosyltransferase involved in cell wall biosynthesis